MSAEQAPKGESGGEKGRGDTDKDKIKMGRGLDFMDAINQI